MNRLLWIALLLLAVATGADIASAQPTGSNWLLGKPAATIDLTTSDGVAAVGGQWRYHDAAIVSIQSPSIGEDLKPSGPLVTTNDIEPKAGEVDFDDSQWPVIDPPTPWDRYGAGRLSFAWFRLQITLPESVGAVLTAGTTVVLETVVDDYAEIWVDGKLTSEIFGQSGGAFVRGWNAPNRVVVARNARPGQVIQVAILAMNGPISSPPANFIWFRSATLDFFSPEDRPSDRSPVVIRRVDPALDSVIPSDAMVEKIGSGFAFTEGPYWTPAADGQPGYLLFSDPNQNTIYRLTEDGELFEFRPKSGYTGMDIGRYRQPGSNGLTRDADGRLTICEHGNRRVTRIEKNGLVTVLADRFEGGRLNSPNDLVYRSDGALFFTDPPFGLPQFHTGPARELSFSGVYCLREGALHVICDDLSGPNGLAFSPDERFLYVGNWDDQNKTVTRLELDGAGQVLSRQLFFDMTSAEGDDAIDGIKVDMQGNVYVSGPGGLWVLSPAGRHLGTLSFPEHPHNFAFGGDDGKTLFLTCQTGVYRMRVNIPGATIDSSAGSAEKRVQRR